MLKTLSLFKQRMKKTIPLLFAAILFPVLLYADAANIIFTAGGNVKQINSESIKMVKEKINITMLGNHFEVGETKMITNTYSQEYFSESGRPKSVEFILEDTMDMQYLAFPEPIYMSSMKISILEVYKGSKWDDTCISELMIFTAE